MRRPYSLTRRARLRDEIPVGARINLAVIRGVLAPIPFS
jgi:hypothetical protein